MQGDVISMLVADKRWLTIWHRDWLDDTLLSLVPQVTRLRLPRHVRGVTVGYLVVSLIAQESWMTASH